MSKLGRQRKKKATWKKCVPTHEVRYTIDYRKSRAGVEYSKYKPVAMVK